MSVETDQCDDTETEAEVHDVGDLDLDAVALKPTECDVSRGVETPFDEVIIDYEGVENLPSESALEEVSGSKNLRVTTPVRAEGFDPLGDCSLHSEIPGGAKRVMVAGHPAYLSENERKKKIAPRLKKAVDEYSDSWVGTESVERLALATGATQFELLSKNTERELNALKDAGFSGEIAVYAPTVLSDDEGEILDAVGEYVARRGRVSEALSKVNGTEKHENNSSATGRRREILLKASRDYALVGSLDEISRRINDLRKAGVDKVVAYPARGIDDVV